MVIAGLFLTGVAYGGLQNLTLAQAFNAAGEPARSSVSIAWNLSFDAGTGLGAFAVGAIATVASYSAAFGVLALAVGLIGRLLGMAEAGQRGRLMLGVVQVALVGGGDAGTVAGGQQVEQQATGNGKAEPGIRPACGLVGAGPLTRPPPIEVSHGSTSCSRNPSVPGRPSSACTYSSKNSRSCGHSFRIGEVRQPRRASARGDSPGRHGLALGFVDREGDRDEQALAGPEVVQQHAVAGADGGRELTQAQIGDPAALAWSTVAASSRSRACDVTIPECTIWFMFHLVQYGGDR